MCPECPVCRQPIESVYFVHEDCSVTNLSRDIVWLSYPRGRVVENMDVIHRQEYDYYVLGTFENIMSTVQSKLNSKPQQSKVWIYKLDPEAYSTNDIEEVDSCILSPSGKVIDSPE